MNLKDFIKYSKSSILSKEILKSGKANITLFCMAANTEMSKHTSTKEAIILVLEGNGLFNLKGKNIKMSNGVIIHMKKNMPHSLKARKNTSFMLFLWNN